MKKEAQKGIVYKLFLLVILNLSVKMGAEYVCPVLS